MNDLLHFVPLTDSVTIRGSKIKLVGVDIGDLGQIFFRFPEIALMISQRKFDVANAGISRQAMVALIAAGCGKAGDEAVEKSLGNLSLGEQSEMFAKVFRLTSPGGIGPFTELVVAMRGADGQAAEAAPAKPKRGVKIHMKP